MVGEVHGQSEQSRKSPAAVDVASLLTQARQAMADNRLDEANALVSRAEAARVRYPMLHFGDTPARVRSDLEKLLVTRQGGPSAPQQDKKAVSIVNRFAAIGSHKKQATQDPFAGASARSRNRQTSGPGQRSIDSPRNRVSPTARRPKGFGRWRCRSSTTLCAAGSADSSKPMQPTKILRSEFNSRSERTSSSWRIKTTRRVGNKVMRSS